jgi:hypothetical protein
MWRLLLVAAIVVGRALSLHSLFRAVGFAMIAAMLLALMAAGQAPQG